MSQGFSKDVAHARRAAGAWVEANRLQWPGLGAAHLVGSITAMPQDAPFPSHKDVDMHLIFDDGSPALNAGSPFLNVVEEEHEGILIEAGIKPAAEYDSPAAVLANPEIAYHLTVDSVLYDPDGMLAALQGPVRQEYARRHWVEARVQHERRGLDGTLELLPMARAMSGTSGEVNIVGYSFTYVAAALAVAALKPPSVGSRMFLRLRENLEENGRLDLYEEILGLLGLSGVSPERVKQLLTAAQEAFDLAVTVRRTPHPFQHKLHAHLRPYFVESCRSMLDEGYHREALGWLAPFYGSSVDVILADGPETEKATFAARRDAFLRELGMDKAEERASRIDRARQAQDACFALADEIVAHHPAVLH